MSVVGTGPSGHDPVGARKHATVNTAPAISRIGTATRSTSAAARGPPSTISVAARPSPTAHPAGVPRFVSRAVIEAAITLLSAIHAKFVTNSSNASVRAPDNPSAARDATND